MLPIRVKFDGRYQRFQVEEESYGDLAFEDGDEYAAAADDLDADEESWDALDDDLDE